MRFIIEKAASIVMTCALVAGSMPVAAFAYTDDGQVQNSRYPQGVTTMEEQAGAYADNQMIVVYQGDGDATAHALSLESAGDTQVEKLADGIGENGGGQAVLVTLPEGKSVTEAIDEVGRQPGVVFAQPNYSYRLLDGEEGDPVSATGKIELSDTTASTSIENLNSTTTPISASTTVSDPITAVRQDDSNQQNQWWLYSVDAFSAWDYARVDKRVTVAILDTGINFAHNDLRANIDFEHAYDAYAQKHMTESPTDEELAHGTHVAGIVAAEANNALGIAGVSYNAQILPINVFHLAYSPQEQKEVAQSSDSDLIRAYTYLMTDDDGDGQTLAQEQNVRVVNMSLGGYDDEKDIAFENVIKKANDAGIVTVAAGGNGEEGIAQTKTSYPSDYDDVVSVVALNSADKRPSWCDYNQYKDIAAPGVDIWSTWYTKSDYACLSGTSMASPLVAGVVALLFAYNPSLTADEAKQVLYDSATDLGAPGRDDYYGYGKVNPKAALASIGAASVTAERSSMVRTSKQQLTAKAVNDSYNVDGWSWSVSDANIATVDADGVLTAKSPGDVKVSVEATNDASVKGEKVITVTDIALPTAVTVVASASERSIVASWDAAECATSYDVYRSEGDETDFALVASIAASPDTKTYQYRDTSVAPGVNYYYRIQPKGMLDLAEVKGVMSGSAMVYFADKTFLNETIDAVISDEAKTAVSVDGLDIACSSQWVSADDVEALESALVNARGISLSGAATQDQVDAATARLLRAQATFDAAKKFGTMKPLDTEWSRLAGQTALDTMNAIVDSSEGFHETGGTVIIATLDGYWDALSASGLAGLSSAPLLMTDGKVLSSQTIGELERLKPSKVIICGGELAVSSDVARAITEECGVEPIRCAGDTATETACKIYGQAEQITGSSWNKTAFIATNSGYWDALSIAPYTYAKHCPLFLSESTGELSKQTIDTMVEGGINQVYIVGGASMVSEQVVSQLARCGITVVDRLAGETALETSDRIVNFEIADGMKLDGMGIATSNGYWDALAGAALCGKNNTVLTLVSDENSSTIDSVVKRQRDLINRGVVFGGSATVSDATFAALAAATKRS